ncbi:unnamed protein product [Tetraodon nigroviridis]|uniref:(spotted green pufferfish) hypothetical protein n=1 Tax=Tetraodon nigroviridis TaxID=99883 RepID=Q4RJY7_TETNG|nr:unnamed protein product [Tetraodon nigroviridis]
MKIASFNAQRFGLRKAQDPDVLSTLIKIVSRYDIIVILEVVDVSGASVKLLLKELNRDDVVDLTDCYQYEDKRADDLDAFAREPYILHFKPHNTDGMYVTHKQMKELRLRSDNNFHWLIGDDMDTTSDTSKEHTYDRHVPLRSANPSWTWLILSFYIYLTGSSCTETICWRPSCQTRPSRLISTRSFA